MKIYKIFHEIFKIYFYLYTKYNIKILKIFIYKSFFRISLYKYQRFSEKKISQKFKRKFLSFLKINYYFLMKITFEFAGVKDKIYEK